jgi:hypothetical protein
MRESTADGGQYPRILEESSTVSSGPACSSGKWIDATSGKNHLLDNANINDVYKVHDARIVVNDDTGDSYLCKVAITYTGTLLYECTYITKSDIIGENESHYSRAVCDRIWGDIVSATEDFRRAYTEEEIVCLYSLPCVQV